MKHETHSRSVQAYPNQFKHKLLIAYCFSNRVGKSTAAMEIIDRFFDALPKAEIEKLLSVYESMTPEQRLNPKNTITKDELEEMKLSDEMITVNDAMDICNVSQQALYDWKKKGLLPYKKQERGILLFKKSDLAIMIEKRIILK